ncbi:MAG TPA: tRNA pseudouridine(38-40) synthase TruA [Candidatus Acidoferrales bacterium]
MRNIKLTLAYDGTDFHGWQVQSSKPTIQGEVTGVLRKITQERITIHGAGRTDAGVHALGQVAHFRTQSALTVEQFQRALNALLPPAIRIVAAEEVGPDFHARWGAVAKTYHYRIFRSRVVPPFDVRYVLHYPYPLDEEAMARAAKLFEGQHDFTSFAASQGNEDDDRERTPTRQIYSCEVSRVCRGGLLPARPDLDGDVLLIAIRGQSFLRYMVRKMAGTLVDIGRGKLAVDDIPRLFELRDRSKSGPTLPPHGLFMVNVEYHEPWRIG